VPTTPPAPVADERHRRLYDRDVLGGAPEARDGTAWGVYVLIRRTHVKALA
jgi:hypothetical protein